MALGKERRPQRPRRNAIDEQRLAVVAGHDVVACGLEIVGAIGNRCQNIRSLVGAPVAAVVAAPGIEAPAGKPVHRRDIARRLQIESRRRGHRGAVHEQDRAGRRRAGLGLFPKEKLLASDLGVVLAAGALDDWNTDGHRVRSWAFGVPEAGWRVWLGR